MNYEQKYKEALEKARQFSEHPLQEDSSSIVEYIFPELKETEDEKIRKAVIEMIHDTPNIECEENYNVRKEDALAWLEKQGEQKPVEWNERDERVLTEIINDVKFTQSKNPNSYMNQLLFKKEIDWLNSLKQRIKEE